MTSTVDTQKSPSQRVFRESSGSICAESSQFSAQ
jgi:hypothetical protein